MSDDKYNEYNDDSNRYEDDQGPTPPDDKEFEPDYSKFNADSVPMQEEQKDVRNYDDIPVGPCPEREAEIEREERD
ncbi:hypothetical protein WR25_20415 [Diploscapter pachys]|uniref:Uncharacterized protein n=1 Tax=Diploscapter pachys TaxID=2018661 RepID=A0A2A2JLX5_9BILA|nr:hypothetical protein WR25_20415 [Diploscapter pachys]